MSVNLIGDDQIKLNIAAILGDYVHAPQNGIDVNHVTRWVEQFSPEDRSFVLTETFRCLNAGYISQNNYESNIRSLLSTEPNRGIIEASAFLDIQEAGRGTSQREIIQLMDIEARNRGDIAITVVRRNSPPGQVQRLNQFIYFDDVSFSGSKALNDLSWFVEFFDLRNINIGVCFLGNHKSSTFWLRGALGKAFSRRNITVRINEEGMIKSIENRLRYSNASEVFWPQTGFANVPDWIQDKSLYQGACRSGFIPTKIFPERFARDRFERILKEVGFYILQQSREPSPYLKPLGFSSFPGLGFGGTLFTYRNCPNNAPLAFWWGLYERRGIAALDCWYPLMRRVGYNQV